MEDLELMLSEEFFKFTDKLKGFHAQIKEKQDKVAAMYEAHKVEIEKAKKAMGEIYAAHKEEVDALKKEAAVILKEFDTWKAEQTKSA